MKRRTRPVDRCARFSLKAYLLYWRLSRLEIIFTISEILTIVLFGGHDRFRVRHTRCKCYRTRSCLKDVDTASIARIIGKHVSSIHTTRLSNPARGVLRQLFRTSDLNGPLITRKLYLCLTTGHSGRRSAPAEPAHRVARQAQDLFDSIFARYFMVNKKAPEAVLHLIT